jgi:hypothetical protein
LGDPLPSKMRTDGNFRVRFSRRKSIHCSRVFLRRVNISTRIFDENVSFPGSYGGLYGQNFPHEFKIKIPVHNCHSEADYLVNDSYYGSAVVRVMAPIAIHHAVVPLHLWTHASVQHATIVKCT